MNDNKSDLNAAAVLGRPLELPCGASLPNRLGKSAMSETLGDPDGAPTPALETLYRTWAEGGTGLLVTGNVMIDARAFGEPGNVALEDDRHADAFRDWAQSVSGTTTKLWMQLNHPGKQSPSFVSKETVAPSAVPLGSGLEKAFVAPRALEDEEVEDLVQRFATAAKLAQDAGFHGVQIHGAHGYLVNQFLSPHHNRRTDRWGGPLQNRMRFLLEILRATRAAVGPAFPIGCKMNSADFQKGGFDENDALVVARTLSEEGIDMLEVSGGNYERPAMTGPKKASTENREAYFLTFAEQLRGTLACPLMLTGGFRSARVMAEAVDSGAIEAVGLARPLALEPDLSKRILAGEDVTSVVGPVSTGIALVDKMTMLAVSYYECQLHRIGAGKAPLPKMSAIRAALTMGLGTGARAFRRRRA